MDVMPALPGFDWSKTPLAGEPHFVLMARDPQAPGLLLMWAQEREAGVEEGRYPGTDAEVVAAMRRLAREMKAWRDRNDGAWRAANPELPLVDLLLAQDPAPLCDCELVSNGHPAEGRLCDRCKRDAEQAAWPDPTPEMLTNPVFNAIWNVIKSWDVAVPNAYAGATGPSGNHVRAIFDAIQAAQRAAVASAEIGFADALGGEAQEPTPRSVAFSREGPDVPAPPANTRVVCLCGATRICAECRAGAGDEEVAAPPPAPAAPRLFSPDFVLYPNGPKPRPIGGAMDYPEL